MEGFSDKAPSIENLLLHFCSLLEDLPGGAKLVHLKLEEHPLLYGELDLTLPEEPRLRSPPHFSSTASHRLHTDALSQEENIQL